MAKMKPVEKMAMGGITMPMPGMPKMPIGKKPVKKPQVKKIVKKKRY